MNKDKLILRTLRLEDELSFLKALDEFSSSGSNMEFAFQYNPQESFKYYVDKVNSWPNSNNASDSFVPNTYFVGIINKTVVGRVSFRHHLNPFLERIGGHIGYCVIPSQQRKGYATEMLKQALDFGRTLGLNKVLITCDTNNIGSKKVIENNGGIFESISNEPDLKIQKNRYWIYLQ